MNLVQTQYVLGFGFLAQFDSKWVRVRVQNSLEFIVDSGLDLGSEPTWDFLQLGWPNTLFKAG